MKPSWRIKPTIAEICSRYLCRGNTLARNQVCVFCRVFNSPPFKGHQRCSGHVIPFKPVSLLGPTEALGLANAKPFDFSGFSAVQMCFFEFCVPIFAIPLGYFMRPILSTQKGDSPEN